MLVLLDARECVSRAVLRGREVSRQTRLGPRLLQGHASER